MEVEAMTLETRGLLLDEGKPDQGYGRHFHFDEIGVSKRSGEMAFEWPVLEKAVAGRGIVKAASWSDLVADFAYGPGAAWTAPAEEFAAGNKAAQAEVFSAGNKAAQAEVFSAGNKAAQAEVFSAGNKAAQAEVFSAGNKAQAERVFAAGNKAAQAEEREEAKSAEAVKKTKKKKVTVKVSEEYINILKENPPKDPTYSQRLRSLNEESEAFSFCRPDALREILDLLPQYADLVDKQNKARIEILRQYDEYGSAYEEIEVDEEIEADECN